MKEIIIAILLGSGVGLILVLLIPFIGHYLSKYFEWVERKLKSYGDK